MFSFYWVAVAYSRSWCWHMRQAQKTIKNRCKTNDLVVLLGASSGPYWWSYRFSYSLGVPHGARKLSLRNAPIHYETNGFRVCVCSSGWPLHIREVDAGTCGRYKKQSKTVTKQMIWWFCLGPLPGLIGSHVVFVFSWGAAWGPKAVAEEWVEVV